MKRILQERIPQLCDKIYAMSKSCVILHNYPNNHKIFCGISKMFQKIVELGIDIHVYIQSKPMK